MRSTPRDHDPVSPTSPVSLPLAPIDEDGDAFTTPRSAPPVPPRAWNRPVHRVFGLGPPPKLNFDNSPPAYSQFDGVGVEGPHGEKLSDVRKGIHNNKHIAKRGGWRRLAIIALLIILCIIALVVGLVVGLRNRHNSSNNNSSSDSGSVGDPATPALNTTFPAGSYSIETYLDTVSTNCTSNSATWGCAPGVTYASSHPGSAATFDWIIVPVEGSSNYTVSTTQNPFSIEFTNISMALKDAGSEQEYYYFQFTMDKSVIPNVALTASNNATTCYFNQTMFQASLYTKMAKTYPENSTSTDTSQSFTPWPYAVKVDQVSSAGTGTPTCLENYSGTSVGDYSVSDTSETCECLYLNTGT